VQATWKKWILSFNIYGNWAGEGECPRLSISGRVNVRRKTVRECPGDMSRGKCPAPFWSSAVYV